MDNRKNLQLQQLLRSSPYGLNISNERLFLNHYQLGGAHKVIRSLAQTRNSSHQDIESYTQIFSNNQRQASLQQTQIFEKQRSQSKLNSRAENKTQQQQKMQQVPIARQTQQLFNDYKSKRNNIEKGIITMRHFREQLKPKVKRLKWEANKELKHETIQIKDLNHVQLVDYFFNQRGTVDKKTSDFDKLLRKCNQSSPNQLRSKKEIEMECFLKNLQKNFILKKKLYKRLNMTAQQFKQQCE